MREERGNWYLLTGFAIGIILGLVFAWVVYPWFAPQEYNDNSPASLQSEFKDQYRSMIALAYVATGNLPRAEARLALLGDSDIVRALAEQAQQTLAEGESTSEAQALGLLAVALGQDEPGSTLSPISSESPTNDQSSNSAQDAVPDPGSTEQPPSASENSETGPSPTASDQTPQVTRTTNSTVTPLPTRTPTATPGSPFVLQENTFVCETTISGPLIQVIAENTNGRALSGQEIVVSWQEGEDRFFSGLKPELGQGYADFLMIPGVVYQVRMSAGGQTVPDITPAECETQGGRRYWGSWLLVFSRP
jgi:hypothetical protein